METRKKITAKVYEGLDLYFFDFLSEKKSLNKAKSTVNNYQVTWGYYKEICEKETVTHDDVLTFINGLRARGLKNVSINHHLRDLRTFLNWCMKLGYMPKFMVEMVEEEEVIQATYQDKDILTLIQKPKQNESFVEWRTWTMLNLFFAGGMRASSACSLKIKDVDFDSNLLILSRTKNKKLLTLPISKELSTVLKVYLRMFRSDAQDDDWLFPNVYGGALSVNAMQLSVEDYNIKRGISMTSTKAIRHSFGKNWVKSGGDIYKLSKVLGHKSVKMTQHYADIWGKDLQEGFEQHNLLDRIKTENSRKHAITRK